VNAQVPRAVTPLCVGVERLVDPRLPPRIGLAVLPEKLCDRAGDRVGLIGVELDVHAGSLRRSHCRKVHRMAKKNNPPAPQQQQPPAPDPRTKNSGHGKKTADKWNQ
jgi:hypothetical protein